MKEFPGSSSDNLIDKTVEITVTTKSRGKGKLWQGERGVWGGGGEEGGAEKQKSKVKVGGGGWIGGWVV